MSIRNDKVTTKPKYTAKDSVFRALFSDPRYLLEMYRTLHPEDTATTEDDLEIITLQQIFCNGPYNDLGFLAGDHLLILVEAQSTWSPNIVVRSLIYAAITYQEYLNRRSANLYSSSKVALPRPEIYVIYTGEREDLPAKLSLRDEFFGGSSAAIDTTANVICLDDSRTIINQYIIFCKVFNEQMILHGRTIDAIKNTIRICSDTDVLREFLESRRTEVEGIMFTLFDQDRVTELWGKEIADKAKAEGEALGEEKGKFKNLKQNVESIMESFGISAEQAIAALKLSPADSARLTAMLG